MKIAFAAALALMLAAPAFAAGTSSISVGVVVTGDVSASLSGTWTARSARDGIYHFTLNRNGGAFYRRVSLPVSNGQDGRCDLRVGGTIYAVEPAGEASYEMQYLVQSAEIVSPAGTPDDCQDVADAYLSDIGTETYGLILFRTADGRLIDRATGTAYSRAH